MNERPSAFLSRAALAAELDIAESTIDEMMRRGTIPGPAKYEPGPLWSWADVEAALAKLPHVGEVVYFIGFGDYIKIGFTSKPLEFRLSAIQVGAPEPLQVFATVPGRMADERRFHKQFAHVRLNGEWFRRCPELTELIEKLARGNK
jgi:predicted DNA-binding transcriptional regulator AlpA